MKVIISTGQGRLHLIDSLKAIKGNISDYQLITGWVPNYTPKTVVTVMGRLVGRNEAFYESMMKRAPKEISVSKICSCTLAEFFQQALFKLSDLNLITRDRAAIIGWFAYGLSSKKYLKNADIFHVRSGAGQGGAIRKAKMKGMKVVVDHSIAHPAEVYRQLIKVEDEKNISISTKSKFWQNVIEDCSNADVLLVNSEYVKQSFRDQGWNFCDIKVIPLGVREDFFNIKLDYSKKGPIKLLFTGRFSSRKGSHIIIAMTKKLIESGRDFELNVVGAIDNQESLPEWFKNADQVNFHGHVLQEELKLFLKTNDIYIFPTYAEGAAQSVKEAMAAGMPVITTFNSGAPIVNNESGIIIPVDDTESLLLSVELLEKNENLRMYLGNNAKNVISNEHTWKKYAEKLIGLYSDCLSK